MNTVLETMKNHRSIRAYSDAPVSEEIIANLIEVAQWAPSSINGQQISVVVIQEAETRQKIAEIAGGQTWIAQAPLFFLFVADFHKASIAAEKVGLPLKVTESVEAIMVASVDAGLAMQNVITAAESLGLGIVPIGGIRRDPEAIIELAGLPQHTFPIAGLVIGHPANHSAQKPRMPKEAFRHDEKYDADKLPAIIDQYDEQMVDYLKTIGREAEGSWSQQTMKFYQYPYFPNVYPILKKQGFENDK